MARRRVAGVKERLLQDGRVFKAIERGEVEREARALMEGSATIL